MEQWRGPPLPARWQTARRPAFVGRRGELGVLRDAWSATTDGLGHAVFIGGEPGAGKSRLIAEACAAFAAAGAAVLVGNCIAELGLPYQPFDGPVASLRIDIGAGLLPDEVDEVSTAAIIERLGTIAGLRRLDETHSDLDERREIYEALVLSVRAAAAQRPLVLVLEDVHWAGATSLQLLSYLIERTTESRLLVLVTHRTTVPDRSENLLAQIGALHRLEGVQRIDLPPLETADVAEFLIHEAALSPRKAASMAVVLRKRTGGNAFFLREMWQDAVLQGSAADLEIEDVPTSMVIREMVNHRIASLSTAQVDVLRTAAVIGEDVAALILTAVVGDENAITALDAIETTGLIEPTVGTSGDYRFRHALARQAVLDLIPSYLRIRLHERIAVVLEHNDGPVQLLAHHYAAAHLLGHTAKAVTYLKAAADVAAGGLAHAEAGQLFERAAHLCANPYQRDGYRLSAARSYHLACDFGRAREICLSVATHGDSAHRLRAATAFEEVAWFTGHSGRRALDMLDRALLDVTPDAHDPQYIGALAALARATALTGAHPAAEELVTRAIGLARANGGDQVIGDALAASMQVGDRPGCYAVKLPRARELTEVASRTGQWLHLGPAAYHRSVMAYQVGDRAALDAARRDLVRTSEAAGQRYWAYLAGCVEFAVALVTADFDTAHTSCQSLLDMGETFGGDDTEGPYGVQSFMVRRETGALAHIRPLITGDEHTADHWAPALLALYTELAMPTAAARVLNGLMADIEPQMQQSRWPAVLGFLAEAVLALGDEDSASRLRPWFDEYAGVNLVMGPFVAVFGAADRYAAGLDSLLGRDTPDQLFAAAHDLDSRSGAPLHQAHTLVAWGAHARRSGDVGRARSLEDAALAIAAPLGMVRVLRALPDQGATSAAPIARPAGLTRREVDVMRLLGEGLTNRDLAARLIISENTAANHVRSILIKTGCANRTQAALFAAAHGLLD